MTDNTQELDEILRDYDDDNACVCYSDCAHPKDTKQAKQAIQTNTNAEIAKVLKTILNSYPKKNRTMNDTNELTRANIDRIITKLKKKNDE